MRAADGKRKVALGRLLALAGGDEAPKALAGELRSRLAVATCQQRRMSGAPMTACGLSALA